MNKAVMAAAMLFLTPLAVANKDTWTSQASFTIEKANLEQTMLWVSGVSYALSMYSEQLALEGKTRLFCAPGNFVTSKVLFDILNTKHAKQNITSEEAIGSIVRNLRERFPCG